MPCKLSPTRSAIFVPKALRPLTSIGSAPKPLSARNNPTMTAWNSRSRIMKQNWLTLTAAALLPVFASGYSPSDRKSAAAEIKGQAQANVPLPEAKGFEF